MTISRETIKVSILYLGPYSENEDDILLQSEQTSLDYREFVQSLGWTVLYLKIKIRLTQMIILDI